MPGVAEGVHFPEVDAFGNAGHRGTDIPAPESTPILAAHSGTVLVSGWNDSYGNQVLLDNGAGLSTRYAHMTQTAVTAGGSGNGRAGYRLCRQYRRQHRFPPAF